MERGREKVKWRERERERMKRMDVETESKIGKREERNRRKNVWNSSSFSVIMYF